jgi:hypothetical protein
MVIGGLQSGRALCEREVEKKPSIAGRLKRRPLTLSRPAIEGFREARPRA